MNQISVAKELKRISYVFLVAFFAALFYISMIYVFQNVSINPFIPYVLIIAILIIAFVNVLITLINQVIKLLSDFTHINPFTIPKNTFIITKKLTYNTNYCYEINYQTLCVNRC